MMHIEWSATQMYNTLMAVAAGVGLLQLVRFGWLIQRDRTISLEGWAMGFGVNGFLLTLLGGAMTLTWPLSKVGFPFDDIIFGEPSLAFGVLMLAGAILLWRKSNLMFRSDPKQLGTKITGGRVADDLTEMTRPLSYFAAAIGLGLIAIAFAGIYYQLFAAPPEEPISGQFADYPLLEASFISGLYALTGIGAILFPFGLNNRKSKLVKVIAVVWTLAGIAFVLFGAMNYFTHIGLIVNTMN